MLRWRPVCVTSRAARVMCPPREMPRLRRPARRATSPDRPAPTTVRSPFDGGGASRRSQRKNSTLPDGPGSGLGVTPATPSPSSAAAAATSSTASARSCGSRTTPPGPTRSLPTSNCGFTIGTRSPSAAVQAASAGSTRRNEMNDRSATVSSPRRRSRPGPRVRTLVRSSTRTRSSVRNGQASWPYPTSTATTSAAPPRNSTSVKPPVDAPASRHRRPATVSPSGPNAASAPASLWPPRDTYRSPGPSPVTSTGSAGSTCAAALRATVPRTSTRPASMSSAGLLTRPREPAADEFGVEPDTARQSAKSTSLALCSMVPSVSCSARCADSYLAIWSPGASRAAFSSERSTASTAGCPVSVTPRPSRLGVLRRRFAPRPAARTAPYAGAGARGRPGGGPGLGNCGLCGNVTVSRLRRRRSARSSWRGLAGLSWPGAASWPGGSSWPARPAFGRGRSWPASLPAAVFAGAARPVSPLRSAAPSASAAVSGRRRSTRSARRPGRRPPAAAR